MHPRVTDFAARQAVKNRFRRHEHRPIRTQLYPPPRVPHRRPRFCIEIRPPERTAYVAEIPLAPHHFKPHFVDLEKRGHALAFRPYAARRKRLPPSP